MCMAMSTSGGGGLAQAAPAPARRPSRYESQKRRDWQTFVRYLAAHRPPLVLRRCSGAHVLEFLRYLDRFGKTRVHTPPCPAYGVRAAEAPAPALCQCPLRQAWGSLDALVGRLRAAFDERHGRGAGGEGQQPSQPSQLPPQQHDHNPFAARAVRLYLRDVRDAQSTARGISYHKKKKKRKAGSSKAAVVASSSSSKNGGVDANGGERPRARGHKTTTTATNAAPAPPPLPPLPPCLTGVPFDQCCDLGTIVRGVSGYGGIYLPLLFNAFS